MVKWHGEPFGVIWYNHGLKRYCHRCGTDPHWWFQRTRCRHYRRFRVKGKFTQHRYAPRPVEDPKCHVCGGPVNGFKECLSEIWSGRNRH